METENRPIPHRPADHDSGTASVRLGRHRMRRARQLRPRHLRSGLTVILALGIVALAATACTHSTAKPAANQATTTTTTPPATTTTTPRTTSTTDPATTTTTAPSAAQSPPGGGDSAALAQYTSCMKAHGIDLPSPAAQGTSPSGSTPINPSSPQFVAASKACQHYLPSGGTPVSNGPGGS